MSLDLSSRSIIANSGIKVTPESTRETNLFSHAIASLFEPHEHIPRDMFEPLPVPDNSLTFITCYDAWPFGTSFDNLQSEEDGGPMSDEEIELSILIAVDRLYKMYQKLTYGGKLVIFPWTTFDSDERSAKILRRVTSLLSREVGHGVQNTVFNYATLQELMSESELNTTSELSNVFSDEESDTVEAMIVEKPARKLVERHTNARDRRMAMANVAQIQD